MLLTPFSKREYTKPKLIIREELLYGIFSELTELGGE
jgi:hypothetical protein